MHGGLHGAGGRLAMLWLAVTVLLAAVAPARAAEPIRVVASFSILGDLVQAVGGPRVSVTTLVGPEADAHGYSPAPADARRLVQANLIVVNGLGFDGWIDRLVRASGTKAPVVVATRGVTTIAGSDDHDHGDPAHGHGSEAGKADPHAWQSIANARIYVGNIRDGLAAADPAQAADYAEAARAYLLKLDALEAEVRAELDRIPPEHRRIITTHDSFAYFATAYGLRFIAPQGVSTDSEATPRDVARIVSQVRRDKVPAVFLENIADPRLMQQVARESGARIGGRIYSDALSRPDGPAATYLDLMRNNARAFGAALGR